MRNKKIHLQYAALPYRVAEEGLRVLLVTSRETKRWVIPKGWPDKHRKPHQVAENEAYEEAGLKGKIAKTPIAAFEYVKQMDDNRQRLCLVEVYPLHVREELAQWPEQQERKRAWMTPSDAAAAVLEAGLTSLLLAFSADLDQVGLTD